MHYDLGNGSRQAANLKNSDDYDTNDYETTVGYYDYLNSGYNPYLRTDLRVTGTVDDLLDDND